MAKRFEITESDKESIKKLYLTEQPEKDTKTFIRETWKLQGTQEDLEECMKAWRKCLA